MAHSVQSTIGNPDMSLFHHSLIKILIQHQLSLSCRSWDEFLVENKLGSTQYWPNPPPKTHRKRKATLKSEMDDIHKAEPGDSKLQEASSPVDTRISNDGTNKVDPFDAETNMDQYLFDKRFSTSVEVDGKLMNDDKIDSVTHEFISDVCTPKNPCDDSTRKLEQLAQVCCDRRSFEPKGSLSVHSRRFTRSMTIVPSISIPVNIQQNTEAIFVQLEDDVLSLIAETMHMNKPITIVENLEKPLAKNITDPSKCEIAPSCMDACGSIHEPSCMSIPSLV